MDVIGTILNAAISKSAGGSVRNGLLRVLHGQCGGFIAALCDLRRQGPANLYVDGDQTFTTSMYLQLTNPLPVGSYRICVDIESTDDEKDTCLFRLLNDAEQDVAGTIYLPRGHNDFTAELTETATWMYIYASTSYNRSKGDTASYTNIVITNAD